MTERESLKPLLDRIAGWIGSFVSFGSMIAGQDRIAALWVLHTYFAPKWPVTPYMHITSAGPGCGKSTFLEVLTALSLNGKFYPTLRPLAVVRVITEMKGAVTCCFDEVEKLAGASASDARSLITSGYTAGGKHTIATGKGSMEFDVYCPKAFACIGSMADVFESRSIQVRLEYGNPRRSWTDAALARGSEAEAIQAEIVKTFAHRSVDWTIPEWLEGRERQIMTPIWSVANGLGLDAKTLKDIRRSMNDLIALKHTSDKVSYKDLAAVPKDETHAYAERLLRDLALVMPTPDKDHSGDISTEHALTALLDGDGPWRVFKGRGLSADVMAQLLSRFGFKAEERTPIREGRGRNAKQLRGYKRKDVMLALEKLNTQD